MAKYAIDGLLLDAPAHLELERQALAGGRWRILYRDRQAVLLVPTEALRSGESAELGR